MPVQTAPVERALDPLGDWVRFNEHTWFLSTDRSSQEISEELQRALKKSSEMILVIALDTADRFGIAPQWVWDWIDSQNQPNPKTVVEILRQSALVVEESGQ
jgi:hypothetical protein